MDLDKTRCSTGMCFVSTPVSLYSEIILRQMKDLEGT